MVAAGVSAIGDVRGAFTQNTKKLSTYDKAIDAGRFPIERGYVLDADDQLRRHVITTLMCNFQVDVPRIEAQHGIRFADYFARELSELADGAGSDGFVRVSDASVEVTPSGRMF